MDFGGLEDSVREAMDDIVGTACVDTNATFKTMEIARYANSAISAYSYHFPYRKSATITVVAGTTSYALPTDILQPPETAIRDARWQRTTFGAWHMARIEWTEGAGETISLAGSGKAYTVWGQNLILADAPLADEAEYTIALQYDALHTPLTITGKTCAEVRAQVLTVPEADIELLFWYTSGLMQSRLEAADAYLRQYARSKDGGLNRDDSPPRRSANWRFQQYDKLVQQRRARMDTPRLRRRLR